VTFFKPQGVPLKTLELVQITVDELEALRLSDYEGLSHEEVARYMKVSRPTVTRMLAKVHRAVADALANGKAIRIEGGDYLLSGMKNYCPDCGSQMVFEPGRSQVFCIKCGSDKGDPAASGSPL